MNVTLNKVLWFTAGAIVGAAVTCNYFKTKYERIAQEEIDSVKRAFSEPTTAEEVTDEPAKDVIVLAQDIIRQHGYSSVEEPAEPIRKEVKGVHRPYVISPADFDTIDEYETFSLIYYEDHILADEAGNVVEDVDAMVGRDSLNHFGEYEDDSVHVRNDALQCDFEILRDLRNYSDVYQNGARPNDD